MDEQHRFGVKQRSQLLLENTITPHLLTMTATPIPRTVALTIYADLDLSILKQKFNLIKTIIFDETGDIISIRNIPPSTEKFICKKGILIVPPGTRHKIKLFGTTYVLQVMQKNLPINSDKEILYG